MNSMFQLFPWPKSHNGQWRLQVVLNTQWFCIIGKELKYMVPQSFVMSSSKHACLSTMERDIITVDSKWTSEVRHSLLRLLTIQIPLDISMVFVRMVHNRGYHSLCSQDMQNSKRPKENCFPTDISQVFIWTIAPLVLEPKPSFIF